MKISIFTPQEEFSLKLQKKLAKIGKVIYSESRDAFSYNELLDLAKDSKIIGADPDNFGGFEKAEPVLTKVVSTLSDVKGIALSTTSTEWVDLPHFKKRGIPVSNIPSYSTESVAEHTLALMLCLAKNIIINDRYYFLGKESKYGSEPGFELKGKTLGVIGLGAIGSRVAELGNAIGMNVMAYNRSPKKQKGVMIKSLNEVLSKSDAISVHLARDKETYHFIGEGEINKMKKGVIVIDLIGPISADMEIVDKKAMARALKSKHVRSYAYEAEDLENNPLSKIDSAIGLKGFAWYTRDALERAKSIWVDNIIAIAKGKPQNRVA